MHQWDIDVTNAAQGKSHLTSGDQCNEIEQKVPETNHAIAAIRGEGSKPGRGEAF